MNEGLMPVSRIKVLALLLANASSNYYLREIARLCSLPLRAVQREMELLERIGLIARTPRGKQVFFAVQTGHPLFGELRELVVKIAALEGAPAAPPRALAAQAPAAGGAGPVLRGPTPAREDSWRMW